MMHFLVSNCFYSGDVYKVALLQFDDADCSKCTVVCCRLSQDHDHHWAGE